MKTLEIVRNADGLAMTDNAGKVKKEFTNIKLFETKRMVHECQIHGEVPCDVFVFNGKPSPTGCPICEREEEKRLEAEKELRRKEKEREAQIERYHEMNVEAEYWDKTMDDYKPIVESQRKAKAAVEKLIAQKHGKVILLGTNGSGKTHLGTMAVKALGGKVLTMYEISCMIRQSYSSLAKRTELEIVEELAAIPMLFIDEIERSKGSKSEMDWLSYILDKRHTRRLPFMLGTNSHLSKDCPNGKNHCNMCFENFLGNDILSRLGQDSEIVTMYDAPDYRRRK